jgi:hypothetical protein
MAELYHFFLISLVTLWIKTFEVLGNGKRYHRHHFGGSVYCHVGLSWALDIQANAPDE